MITEMENMMRRHPYFLGLAVIAVIWVVFLAAPLVAKKAISWTPSSLEQEVLAGKTVTTSVSFIVPKKLHDTVIEVSPELAGLVAVNPTSLEVIPGDKEVVVTLTISPAATASPEAIEGAIMLRKDRGQGEAYQPPLPVKVNVKWPTVSAEGVQIQFPPTIQELGGIVGSPQVSIRENGTRFLDVPLSVNGGPSEGTFGILIHENPNLLSLEDWFAREIDIEGSLQSAGTFTKVNLADGKQALIGNGPVPDAFDGPPLSYAYILSPNKRSIASLSLAQEHELELLGFATPGARESLLRAIVEHFTFEE